MRALLVLSLLAPLVGCNQLKKIDDGGDSGNGDCVPEPVQVIFNASCTVPAGCHEAPNSHGLVLLPGSPVIGASGNSGLTAIEIGNPEGSYLVQKITPGAMIAGGTPMPPTGFLPEDQIATIYGWVAGAPLACADPTATGTDPTMGTMTGTMTTTPMTDTGPAIVGCSIEDVAPGTSNPIQAGNEAGMIPTDIADVLERNCGCHYATAVSPYLDYSGLVDMATHTGFQADTPTVPGMPVYALSLARLDGSGPLMPPLCEPPVCGYGGCYTDEGTNITMADDTLLRAWLEADAPDGATWMGM